MVLSQFTYKDRDISLFLFFSMRYNHSYIGIMAYDNHLTYQPGIPSLTKKTLNYLLMTWIQQFSLNLVSLTQSQPTSYLNGYRVALQHMQQQNRHVSVDMVSYLLAKCLPCMCSPHPNKLV